MGIEDDMTETKTQIETLEKEKKRIKKELQVECVQSATLKGECLQFSEKIDDLEKEIQRQRENIKDLKEKLMNKANEIGSVLTSFNRSQNFNEEQAKALIAEKKTWIIS